MAVVLLYGVPTTRGLNGEDPTAFVLSANIHRRHMTKGQRAMAVAMIYPEAEKTAPGKKSKDTVLFAAKSVSGAGVSKARTVIEHAPELGIKSRRFFVFSKMGRGPKKGNPFRVD